MKGGGEGTVTVTINKSKQGNDIIFEGYVFLSSGYRYLPPFLPHFRFSTRKTNYKRFVEDYNDYVNKIYSEYQKDDFEEKDVISSFIDFGDRVRELQASSFGYGPLSFVMEQDVSDVVIFTNDTEVPWHLFYNPTSGCDDVNQILQAGRSLGTIFVDKMDQEYLQHFSNTLEHQESNVCSSLEEALDNKKFLFIRGDYQDSKFNKLIDQEIKRISDIITGNGRYNVDILEAKSWDEISELLQQDDIIHNLELIYYSGHMTVDEHGKLKMDLGHEKVGANRFAKFNVEYKSEPLVFLNACSSGKVENIINKGQFFSTKFLDDYASGCIVTMGPVEADVSKEFAVNFFDYLLEDPAHRDYGEALSIAREKLDYSPLTLLFHLYGDPNAKMAYVEGEREALIEIGLPDESS